MGEVFYDALYLFSCGARGLEPVKVRDFDILKIYDIATSQGIWQTTFLAIKNLYEQGRLDVDKKVFATWRQEVLNQAIQGVQRNAAVAEVINALERNGIQCCVLKGEVYAALYHDPACRISGDTDILIDKGSLDKAVDILKKLNFTVKGYAGSHHIIFYKLNTGLIELHFQLYGGAAEGWFGPRNFNKENYRQLKTGRGEHITTLGIDDGFIFAVLHLIIHFLGRGVGVRQLMDVLLYMVHYKDAINWDRYNELMVHLKYAKFMEHVVGIGIKYLGFSPDDLPAGEYSDDLMKKILSDIEKGGIFGRKEADRGRFAAVYTRERLKKTSHGNYARYLGARLKNIVKVLLPKREAMLQKYPYAAAGRLLLFVAWMHRFFNFFRDVFKRNKAVQHYTVPEKSIDTVKERLILVRELDMI